MLSTILSCTSGHLYTLLRRCLGTQLPCRPSLRPQSLHPFPFAWGRYQGSGRRTGFAFSAVGPSSESILGRGVGDTWTGLHDGHLPVAHLLTERVRSEFFSQKPVKVYKAFSFEPPRTQAPLVWDKEVLIWGPTEVTTQKGLQVLESCFPCGLCWQLLNFSRLWTVTPTCWSLLKEARLFFYCLLAWFHRARRMVLLRGSWPQSQATEFLHGSLLPSLWSWELFRLSKTIKDPHRAFAYIGFIYGYLPY